MIVFVLMGNDKQDSEKLKLIYKKLTSSYGDIYEQEYFDAFPNSFETFNSMFGYSEKGSFDVNSD
jgi:hypothetical protein